ncbi:MAG TPA: response regulator [Anaerolineaceae bacterium]
MFDILIIDDDPITVNILKKSLEINGFSVRPVTDARKGLLEAFRDPPDLIILDYMMPYRDGLTLLEDIRSNLETSQVPVIMMTATAVPEVVRSALRQGVTDFIVKPVDTPLVIDRVRKHLHLP